MAMLADFLHALKYIFFDDRFVMVGEDRLFVLRVQTPLLIPQGIGVTLEVYQTSCIIPHLQDLRYHGAVPMAGILRDHAESVDASRILVGCRT